MFISSYINQVFFPKDRHLLFLEISQYHTHTKQKEFILCGF